MTTKDEKPFEARGNTVLITAASTAPTGAQVAPSAGYATGGAHIYRVANTGSVTVWLGVSNTAAGAQTNAAKPATTGAGIPILAGAVELFSFDSSSYFSGYSTASCEVAITPGVGL